MKTLIDRCKALCFLDNEKEAVAFAVASHFEQAIRYISEIHESSQDGEHHDYIKIPKQQWQRLVNTLNLPY